MSVDREFSAALRHGDFDAELRAVYPDDLPEQRERLAGVADRFATHYTADRVRLFSAPGRTELGGNHTDHNGGRVLAASVALDTVGAVSPRGDRRVEVISVGFDGVISVDLDRLEPDDGEHGTPQALIRGVAAFLETAGFATGGFNAVVESRVGAGSGLSSSASFEVFVATVFSFLYNGARLTPVQIARAGRHAENLFFGKPSGLMDQIACAAGGVVAIDFADEDAPEVERIPLRMRDYGYQLYAVDSGESHADLTADYAAVVEEMHAAAQALGTDRLREVDYEQFRGRIPEVRRAAGDRGVLRALHFFRDNERVLRQSRMLKDGDIGGFLAEVRESGSSSWRLLQNCHPPGSAERQGIALALALTEEFLARPDLFPYPPRIEGATRVHGGGFAGTIQTYVPVARAAAYREAMTAVFGPEAITELTLREIGACLLADSGAATPTD
jgi:galactokinase